MHVSVIGQQEHLPFPLQLPLEPCCRNSDCPIVAVVGAFARELLDERVVMMLVGKHKHPPPMSLSHALQPLIHGQDHIAQSTLRRCHFQEVHLVECDIGINHHASSIGPPAIRLSREVVSQMP
eukprot:299394-Hanusia_phi.AAC.1